MKNAENKGLPQPKTEQHTELQIVSSFQMEYLLNISQAQI